VDQKAVTRVTVPKGRKTVSPKTFKSICDQAQLSKELMLELCRCSLTGPKYAQLWRDGRLTGR
jgi:hypothetical protein